MERYRVVRQIGKGSFGKVFLVHALREGGARYVLKTVRLRGVHQQERDACANEVALLSRLNHPSIVSFKESFLTPQGDLAIVMEYAEGGDLARRIADHRALGRAISEEVAMGWFVQLLLAVEHCHSAHILHRDIKAQNAFLLASGRVVLGDFGISKALPQGGPAAFARTQIGTPLAMAPEVLAGQRYDWKSDCWALGCLLYELLAGRPPFEAPSLPALTDKVRRGVYAPLGGHVSAGLRGLVGGLLATAPSARPSPAAALRTPFVRKHLYSFIRDTAERAAVSAGRAGGGGGGGAAANGGGGGGAIGDGTRVLHAAASRVAAAAAVDGGAGGVAPAQQQLLATAAQLGPHAQSLYRQLKSLGLDDTVARALRDAAGAGAAGVAVAQLQSARGGHAPSAAAAPGAARAAPAAGARVPPLLPPPPPHPTPFPVGAPHVSSSAPGSGAPQPRPPSAPPPPPPPPVPSAAADAALQLLLAVHGAAKRLSPLPARHSRIQQQQLVKDRQAALEREEERRGAVETALARLRAERAARQQPQPQQQQRRRQPHAAPLVSAAAHRPPSPLRKRRFVASEADDNNAPLSAARAVRAHPAAPSQPPSMASAIAGGGPSAAAAAATPPPSALVKAASLPADGGGALPPVKAVATAAAGKLAVGGGKAPAPQPPTASALAPRVARAPGAVAAAQRGDVVCVQQPILLSRLFAAPLAGGVAAGAGGGDTPLAAPLLPMTPPTKRPVPPGGGSGTPPLPWPPAPRPGSSSHPLDPPHHRHGPAQHPSGGGGSTSGKAVAAAAVAARRVEQEQERREQERRHVAELELWELQQLLAARASPVLPPLPPSTGGGDVGGRGGGSALGEGQPSSPDAHHLRLARSRPFLLGAASEDAPRPAAAAALATAAAVAGSSGSGLLLRAESAASVLGTHSGSSLKLPPPLSPTAAWRRQQAAAGLSSSPWEASPASAELRRASSLPAHELLSALGGRASAAASPCAVDAPLPPLSAPPRSPHPPTVDDLLVSSAQALGASPDAARGSRDVFPITATSTAPRVPASAGGGGGATPPSRREGPVGRSPTGPSSGSSFYSRYGSPGDVAAHLLGQAQRTAADDERARRAAAAQAEEERRFMELAQAARQSTEERRARLASRDGRIGSCAELALPGALFSPPAHGGRGVAAVAVAPPCGHDSRAGGDEGGDDRVLTPPSAGSDLSVDEGAKQLAGRGGAHLEGAAELSRFLHFGSLPPAPLLAAGGGDETASPEATARSTGGSSCDEWVPEALAVVAPDAVVDGAVSPAAAAPAGLGAHAAVDDDEACGYEEVAEALISKGRQEEEQQEQEQEGGGEADEEEQEQGGGIDVDADTVCSLGGGSVVHADEAEEAGAEAEGDDLALREAALQEELLRASLRCDGIRAVLQAAASGSSNEYDDGDGGGTVKEDAESDGGGAGSGVQCGGGARAMRPQPLPARYRLARRPSRRHRLGAALHGSSGRFGRASASTATTEATAGGGGGCDDDGSCSSTTTTGWVTDAPPPTATSAAPGGDREELPPPVEDAALLPPLSCPPPADVADAPASFAAADGGAARATPPRLPAGGAVVQPARTRIALAPSIRAKLQQPLSLLMPGLLAVAGASGDGGSCALASSSLVTAAAASFGCSFSSSGSPSSSSSSSSSAAALVASFTPATHTAHRERRHAALAESGVSSDLDDGSSERGSSADSAGDDETDSEADPRVDPRDGGAAAPATRAGAAAMFGSALAAPAGVAAVSLAGRHHLAPRAAALRAALSAQLGPRVLSQAHALMCAALDESLSDADDGGGSGGGESSAAGTGSGGSVAVTFPEVAACVRRAGCVPEGALGDALAALLSLVELQAELGLSERDCY